MPQLNDAMREEFAKLLAGGTCRGEALRAVNARAASWREETVVRRAESLAEEGDVKARVAELLTAAAEKGILSKRERMVWLSRVITTPPAEVDEGSDLCQEVNETGHGRRMKMVGKIEAMRELNRMDGAYEPERLEQVVAVFGDEEQARADAVLRAALERARAQRERRE